MQDKCKLHNNCNNESQTVEYMASITGTKGMCIYNKGLVLYCPAVTSPIFATYFQEKEGGA